MRSKIVTTLSAVLAVAALIAASLMVAGPALAAVPAARQAQHTAARPTTLTSGAAPRPVVYDCQGWRGGQIRARAIALSCFGSVVLKISRWKYWTGRSARSAAATLGVDNCKPDCVSGTFRRYAATVVLYRVRSRHGTRYFTRLRIQYRHGGPRRYTFRWATYPGARIPVWTGGPRSARG